MFFRKFQSLIYIVAIVSFSFLHGQSCSRALRIVVLGSSTSAGVGATVPDSAYVNRYLKFLKDSVNASCEIINLAVSGTTTYAMQPDGFIVPNDRSQFAVDPDRNITKAISLRPDAILINFPTNDIANNFTEKEQRANFIRVIDLATRANIPIWITTSQPRNFTSFDKKLALIEMRRWIMETFPSRYIDFYKGLADNASLGILDDFDSDGIHVNDAGHKIFASRVKSSNMHLILCK